MQRRSLTTTQHSKQLLLIRNLDVAIHHKIEAYLTMTCQINNIKITQVCSKNLDLESQTKTKALFLETKILLLETKYCFFRFKILFLETKILFQETKVLFQETKVLFQKTKILFLKSMSFLLKLDEFFRQDKKLIPFDVQNYYI